MPLYIKCVVLRVNYKVNYGLQMIMMCQCGFINCNKYTNLVGDVDNLIIGEAIHVGGRRFRESIPSPQFLL